MLHFRLHFLPDMPKRELLIFYKVVQLRIDKVITMSLVCYFYFLGHSVVWLMLHRKVRVLCPSSHYLFLSFTKIYSTFVIWYVGEIQLEYCCYSWMHCFVSISHLVLAQRFVNFASKLYGSFTLLTALHSLVCSDVKKLLTHLLTHKRTKQTDSVINAVIS